MASRPVADAADAVSGVPHAATSLGPRQGLSPTPSLPAHPPARDAGDGADSQHTDAIDQILENYNFICRPEMRLKFKQHLRGGSFSIAMAKPWGQRRPRARIVVKPAQGGRVSHFINKLLVVPTHGLLATYSAKIPLWVLRLQFMASYNWLTQQPNLDYRITTKWSDGPRLKHKATYHLGHHGIARAKWSLDMQLPDLEGHLGPDSLELEAVDVDYGHLDFEVNQVDLVLLSPWGREPPRRPPIDAESAVGFGRSGGAAAWRKRRLGGGSPEEDDGAAELGVPAAATGMEAVPGGRQLEGHRALLGPMAQGDQVGRPPGSTAAPEPGDRPPFTSQMQPVVPDWLVDFLCKLSIKPPNVGAPSGAQAP